MYLRDTSEISFKRGISLEKFGGMMTTTTKATDKQLQANVEKVVAAVVARSAEQRLSTNGTLEWDTDLSVREIREALRVACAQERILFRISTARGITYFVH